MGDVLQLRSRTPLRVRVYADDLGEFTVAVPRSLSVGGADYRAFATAAEARQYGRETARRNFMLFVDETLPDLGGAA